MSGYIDTVDLEQVKRWVLFPFVKGVTTNPLVLQNAQVKNRQSHLRRIEELLGPDHQLMIQAVGKNFDSLRDDAFYLRQEFPKAIIKIPADALGFAVASEIINSGAEVCFTVVYSSAQGILGGLAGGRFVAPYIGRMQDARLDPWKAIDEMRSAFTIHAPNCKILAASIRTPEDLSKAFAMGCSVTAKPAVWEQCLANPSASRAMEEFNAAAVCE